MDKTSLNIQVGNSTNLVTTVNPTDAKNNNVNWSSSEASVATVDNTEKISAVGCGDAITRVTTVEGGYTAVSNVHAFTAITPFRYAGASRFETALQIGSEVLKNNLSKTAVLI